MLDIEYCKKLVRDWPITVEVYNSGQIGFCARPMVNGRRFNKNFSTSKWGSADRAADAAISFCQKTLQKHSPLQTRGVQDAIPARFLSQYESLHHQAVTHGVDPIEVLRSGIQARIHELSNELTLSQVVQRFILIQATKGLKEGYLQDLRGFYAAFDSDFGRVKMADLAPEDVELWLRKRMHEKVIKSPLTWNDWRRKLLQLWEFALMPENGWVPRNVVEEIPQK
jgi:hypothetical protein